jgi:hypothetical protein
MQRASKGVGVPFWPKQVECGDFWQRAREHHENVALLSAVML